MINFENSLNTAKQQLLAWSSYAKLTEITLVRDAKGQISIYLMPKSNRNRFKRASSYHQHFSQSLRLFF